MTILDPDGVVEVWVEGVGFGVPNLGIHVTICSVAGELVIHKTKQLCYSNRLGPQLSFGIFYIPKE